MPQAKLGQAFSLLDEYYLKPAWGWISALYCNTVEKSESYVSIVTNY